MLKVYNDVNDNARVICLLFTSNSRIFYPYGTGKRQNLGLVYLALTCTNFQQECFFIVTYLLCHGNSFYIRSNPKDSNFVAFLQHAWDTEDLF